MRLAAQMRGGFYPAPHEAITHAATCLCPPGDEPFAILDPCAGEGAAIHQLGELLRCLPSLTFAIELDDGRAKLFPDDAAAIKHAESLVRQKTVKGYVEVK